MCGRSHLNSEYFAYLQSPGWKQIRAQRLSLSGGRCEVCKTTKRLDVHHLTYARIFKEKLGDLIVLCRDHHTEAEAIIASGRLTRTGTHLRAKTLRALIPKRTPASDFQDSLLRDASFVCLLREAPDRKSFKKALKCRVRGNPNFHRVMNNALVLWKRRKEILR